MKFGHKYLFPPALTLFWFALGAAAVLIADIAVSLVHSYLSEIMPNIFPSPSPISEPEAYERIRTALSLVIITLTLVPVTYFAMRLDNKRFEHLITLTEGTYPIGERFIWHLKSFWLTDLISTAISATVMTLPVFLIPERYVGPFLYVFWCGGRLAEHFSLAESLLIIIGISVALRVILLPSVLRAWRASWLTGSID